MEHIEKQPNRLLTRHDLVELGVRYSNTNLLQLEKIDAFPRRIRLTPQRVVWDEAEVREWIENRKLERK